MRKSQSIPHIAIYDSRPYKGSNTENTSVYLYKDVINSGNDAKNDYETLIQKENLQKEKFSLEVVKLEPTNSNRKP